MRLLGAASINSEADPLTFRMQNVITSLTTNFSIHGRLMRQLSCLSLMVEVAEAGFNNFPMN